MAHNKTNLREKISFAKEVQNVKNLTRAGYRLKKRTSHDTAFYEKNVGVPWAKQRAKGANHLRGRAKSPIRSRSDVWGSPSHQKKKKEGGKIIKKRFSKGKRNGIILATKKKKGAFFWYRGGEDLGTP